MDINQKTKEIIALITKESIDEYRKYTSSALIPIVEYIHLHSIASQEQIFDLFGVSFLSFLIGAHSDLLVQDDDEDLIQTILNMVTDDPKLRGFFSSINIIASDELDLVEMLEGIDITWT